MKPYDYVIVGAGFFGATVARELTDRGKRVVVIDRRPTYAGTAHSDIKDGIQFHTHGPHVLHSNSDRVWDYLKRFTSIIPYTQITKAMAGGQLYSFPINLETVEQVYGLTDPDEAHVLRLFVTKDAAPGDNIEAWCYRNIGEHMYKLFIEGYTRKQWNREPRDLHEWIVRRLPVRWTERDDRYFDVKHQGLPDMGYTAMVHQMLKGIEVKLGVDYLDSREHWRTQADKVIYSGSLDELFHFCYGTLDYRTTRFEHEWYDTTFQGRPTINYCDAHLPWTRTTEYKYFPPNNPLQIPSLVVREFPDEYTWGSEAYYPINDVKNMALAKRYADHAAATGIIVGGRLGRYQYHDIDQVVASGIRLVEDLTKCP